MMCCASSDHGADREVRPPKPCGARIANGVWCTRADGHEGDHSSLAEPLYGPIEERPALWRKHTGQQVKCGAEVDGAWCVFQHGHAGPHGAK